MVYWKERACTFKMVVDKIIVSVLEKDKASWQTGRATEVNAVKSKYTLDDI